MGMTDVRVRIANLTDPRRSAEVDLVVDSGAIYSVVPTAVLRRIGVAPRKVETFALANGGTVRRAIGDVYYEIDRSAGAAPVIFGRRGDTSLLGVVTLEALGLRLDPLRRTLRPLRLMIA
jgi:predicted aspartyl protease